MKVSQLIKLLSTYPAATEVLVEGYENGYDPVSWDPIHQARHAEIVSTLMTVAKNYSVEIPGHWL